MSGSALDWLRRSAADAPPAIVNEMERAVLLDGESAEVPQRLAEAAVACLRQAVQLGDERAAALPLLAADALMTAACEAAASAGELERLCDAYSAPALSRSVPFA